MTMQHERPTKTSAPGTLTAPEWGWTCFTMEIGDVVPPGNYEVVIGWSAHLRSALPALRAENGSIVGFIHPGSRLKHAPRHILLGLERALDIVIDSRRAYLRLMEILDDCSSSFGEVVTLEVLPYVQ